MYKILLLGSEMYFRKERLRRGWRIKLLPHQVGIFRSSEGGDSKSHSKRPPPYLNSATPPIQNFTLSAFCRISWVSPRVFNVGLSFVHFLLVSVTHGFFDLLFNKDLQKLIFYGKIWRRQIRISSLYLWSFTYEFVGHIKNKEKFQKSIIYCISIHKINSYYVWFKLVIWKVYSRKSIITKLLVLIIFVNPLSL